MAAAYIRKGEHMKRLSCFAFAISFWLMACLPATGHESPIATSLPAATATLEVTESHLVTHKDVDNKFEITYSKNDFTTDLEASNADLFILLLNAEKLFSGKNLEEVKVSMAVNSVCQYLDGYSMTAVIEKTSINGIDFTRYSARDSATSVNVFETITYQTVRFERCYELDISIREYVLSEFFPDLTEYARPLLEATLDRLVQSFKFIE